MDIHTPDWVKHAVFYQIFPDRFCRSARTQHPRGIQFKRWGAPPEEQGYQGGDLYGIVEKLGYLQNLGVTALYLNPIFAAASNHRYNAYDYLQVDPLLGGDAALRELLDEAHRRKMRIVLDGVFNHCGRGFWAFHHLLENGGNSPYADWFTVHEYPLHPYPMPGQAHNYASWWGVESLPKFNTDNPGVRDYLLHVTRYWLEFGIDGWRLDVPQEIDDDAFWRDFRRVVKGVNPEAYIVGEIWHEARHWLQGDMFDAVMNYQITGPALSFFGAGNLNLTWRHPDVVLKPATAARFRSQIEAMFDLYDWEIHYAQLNMLDSHDMPRARWLLNGDKPALRLAVLCQMTMPGAPCVYYGDELGMSAGTDPLCREAFPWHRCEDWDTDLQDFYRAAIALRHAHPALQTGDFSFLYARGDVAAYRRRLFAQEVLVVFNAGKRPKIVNLPADGLAHTSYRQVWPDGDSGVQIQAGKLLLRLPPQSAQVWVA
ncbi:MAG: glycoside hydrolase family 13 protein [Chloroflexota bacterium]